MATNSKIGKKRFVNKSPILPANLKSVTQTRHDIQSWRRAQNMFQNSDHPINYPLQLLYNNVMLDGLLTSQFENRKEQTLAAEFTITSGGKEDEDTTKLLRDTPAYRSIVNAILDAQFRGYSMVELSFDEHKKLQANSIARTNIIPQHGIFYPDYLEPKNPIRYREMREFGIYILEFNMLDMATQEIGLLNKSIPHVLMKRFTQSCWSELAEIFGMPIRTLKTNTMDVGMMNRGEKMMQAMGAAAYAIIDEDESLEFAQSTNTNGDVYQNFINLCNNEISMLISGAIIGQDTKHGNRSKDESAQDMLAYKVESDMRLVETVFNSQVIHALVQHGIVKPGAHFKFNEAEDIDQLWKFTKEILPHKNVPNDWIREKFGVEVEDKPETPTNLSYLSSSFFD